MNEPKTGQEVETPQTPQLEIQGIEFEAPTLLIPQPKVDSDLVEPAPKEGQTEYYKPIGARVLIEPYTISSTTAFEGLVLPQTQDKPTNVGIVREIGTAFLDKGVRSFYPFDIGTTVVFNPSGAIEILKDMKRLFIVDCEQVIATKEIKDVVSEEQATELFNQWREAAVPTPEQMAAAAFPVATGSVVPSAPVVRDCNSIPASAE